MFLMYSHFRYGYDSDDPFIDNSDVHDEIVPETLAPAHGGFYVNCGRLEYKARESADENSDLDAVIQEGEKAAAIQKRKYVRKRKKGDEGAPAATPAATPAASTQQQQQQQKNSGKKGHIHE